MTLNALAAPYPLDEPPHTGLHPVVLARLMLIFAITLQSPSGTKAEGLLRLTEPPGVPTRRLVTEVRSWVTTNEAMQGNLNCFACIILEGIYEVNCGNFRRGWAVFRRAITVAQLMGLYRSPLPPLQRIDRELDADPESMWFRIVYMDRYLSLLLGLPKGTFDKNVGITSAPRDETPLSKFERLLIMVASRILERNENRLSSTEQQAVTQSIDTNLLQVSRSVPANLWRPPEFHGMEPGSPEAMLETKRLVSHVYYHALLVQLHLPYAMHIGDSTVSEYSKNTCVNSSREIISRFIAHRTFNSASSCSRPVDFFALLATMTLLLAHMDAHRHRESTNFSAHQRPSDRAMLQQALERMAAIKTVNKDMTTVKSAELIRGLLAIEEDAAGGTDYTARSGQEGRREGLPGNQENELHLTVPYFGVIRIARQGPIFQRSLIETPPSSREAEPPLDGQITAACDVTLLETVTPPPNSPPGGRVMGQSSNAKLESAWTANPGMHFSGSTSDALLLPDFEGLPGITADVDDWAFQGVDMAFFDGLMRSAADSDSAGPEWY
ncbi:hypothetical protein VTH82DRAFT_7132 [Thermothelomyces myriococcoides]